jgi:hypothetical protein
MSLGEQNNLSERLLIYLPCYLDYKLAIAQAEKISALKKSGNVNLEILVMISCNGVKLSSLEQTKMSQLCDFVLYYPFGISGDINITQGFMHALRLEADYLWILSANDEVSEHFIESIVNELVFHEDVHILVGCDTEKNELRNIDSVFDPENQSIPFGLISAVVYRTKEMSRNFDTAVQMNWTGWGQLATIEASCISLGGIKVSLVQASELYIRSTRILTNREEERSRVRNGYAHSFFGMPIVINTLYAANARKRRQYLNKWIIGNWYLVNYFRGTNFSLWSSHVASNQIWLRDLSFASLRNASISYRLILMVGKSLKFHLIRDMQWAKHIRRKFLD